jgi:PKD repeat protein
VDQEHTALLHASLALLDPRYYYFDNFVLNENHFYMVDFMQGISNTYPNISELIDIGNAWQADHGGHIRDMWVMRITSEDPNFGPIEDKPAFFLFANVHAREVTTPEMAIRYIKYLTSGYNSQGGYGIDPDVTWLVNHHAVYILVSQNPDGHAINESNWGLYRRKNMDTAGCTIDPNNWGVDLNRNSSFKWGCCGGSSGSPCAETYRGPTRNSEPETQAFQTFFASIFPDQNGNNGDDQIPIAAPNNTTGIFLSLHSYGDEVLWPWGFNASLDPPNVTQLSTIGRKLAYLTTYYPLHNLYTVDGDNADWVYGKLGVPAFTYEIGADYGTCGDFFPAYACQDGEGVSRNFWAENRPSFIYLHKIARTPYMTAYGPDSNTLSVNPSTVISDNPVNLSAFIMDYRYSGDLTANIGGAEYFIDTEGIDGTGIAMSPSDGTWGGSTETVESIVDTTDLSAGQHYILVHGRNVNGDWGPFTAVFLIIEQADPPIAEFTSNSPVVLGYPINFENFSTGSEPLTYTWDFGDGVGISTEINPTYLYTNPGTFTVTLVATNPIGSDTISHMVIINGNKIFIPVSLK